jgi:hypothetical protein
MKKNTLVLIRTISIIFLLITAIGFPRDTAKAFNGGYHNDLIRECLIEKGFSESAIKYVQLASLYTDFYGSADENGDVRKIFPNDKLNQLSGHYLHFTQLKDYDSIKSNWALIENNTYFAVKEAEKLNDPGGLLAVLGITLHNVQDFYAHSNWSGIDWEGDATYFDIPTSEKDKSVKDGSKKISTIVGNEHDTLNKDYAGRPGFEKAYREAYYATCQYIERITSWIPSDFWMKAKNFRDPDVFVEEEKAEQLLFVTDQWKVDAGNSALFGLLPVTGDELLGAAQEYKDVKHPVREKFEIYLPRIAPPAKTYIKFLPNIFDLSKGQHYPFIEGKNWVEIKTISVWQTDDDPFNDIEPGGEADFYSIIFYEDRGYTESWYLDRDEIYPTNWETIIPLEKDQTQMTFIYELWDRENGASFSILDEIGISDIGLNLGLRGDKDAKCDINPEKDKEGYKYDEPIPNPIATFTKDIVGPFKTFEIQTNGMSYIEGSSTDGNEAAVDLLVTFRNVPRVDNKNPKPVLSPGVFTMPTQFQITVKATATPTATPK